MRNGAKQAKAGQFLKETVFDKIVDKEDELIAQEEKKETNMYWRAVKKHDEDKIAMKKSLNDKSPFMEISTPSLGWLSSTRTLRRSSTAGQSRLNSLSRLLRSS